MKKATNKTTQKELDTKLAKIRRLMTTQAAGNKTAYAIGVEVDAVRAAPGKYGKGAVETLAREAGCTAALLYSYASVAAAWSPQEFARLLQKTTSKGFPLSFSHLVEVAKAPGGRREEFVRRALDDSLSVRATAKLVAASRPAKKRGTATNGIDQVLVRVCSKADRARVTMEEDLSLLASMVRSVLAGGGGPSDLQPDAVVVALRKLQLTYSLVTNHLEALANVGARELTPSEAPKALLPAQAVKEEAHHAA